MYVGKARELLFLLEGIHVGTVESIEACHFLPNLRDEVLKVI